jgi:fructose-bisphosphate aldolase class II
MPLAEIGDLVTPAAAKGRGVGAFNVIQLEHAEAIVTGAERVGAPVVLQISENTVAFHRGLLAPIGRACLAIAEAATVPVAVHLDHATREDLVHEAVRLGIRSVMYDASALTYEENVAATAAVVRWCGDYGAWVEAELGEVGGKDGVHAPGARTDPDDAARYVSYTKVHALAVAVGSSHAMLTRDAVLDIELIRKIHAAVPVPLVLHGSSGVPDTGMTDAVAAGMTKINIATHLNKALTAAVREKLGSDPALVDPRKYLGPGRDAIADQVAHLLGVLRATG